MTGYMGKVLRVDLADRRTWDNPLDVHHARAFIGGSGLAARYLLDLIGSDTDPLGPANPLILMTGPMVGTVMPSAGRFSVAALSPLTGIWGEANAGGFFGPELKFAGYDGVIITGAAQRPVWLSIVDGAPEIHDADGLWGLDTYETQTEIHARLGDSRARVVCIGKRASTSSRWRR